MKTIFRYSILFFLVLFVFACKTTNHLFLAAAPEGAQLVFLRPVEFKNINPVIKKASVDVTAQIKKMQLVENPIFNYTLVVSNGDLEMADSIEVTFVWEEDGEMKSLVPVEKTRLFKKINKKNGEARYSLSFDKDEFLQMLINGSRIKIIFITPDVYAVRVESESFNLQMEELKLMLI